jgi:hypothetical protein
MAIQLGFLRVLFLSSSNKKKRKEIEFLEGK